MKYIWYNIKSFFRHKRLIFFLVIVSVLCSCVMIHFSYGLFQNYQLKKEYDLSGQREISFKLLDNFEEMPDEGLTWRECVLIHVRNVVLMQFGTFAVTVLCICLWERLGGLERTMFSMGGWQLLGCAGVMLLFKLFGATLSFLLIGKRSAKDILREVD